MKPFPFAIWPQTFQKGSLKTTTFEQEVSQPHISSILATPVKTGGDFVHNGSSYALTDQSKKIVENARNYRGNSEIVKSISETPVIVPGSLRTFLRSNGYPETAHDQIVSDNITAHESQRQKYKESGLDPTDAKRSPVYFFAPGVHEAMMHHLSTTSDVFGSGQTKTPIEQSGVLLGTHHIDTETGTPYIVATHYVPQTQHEGSNRTARTLSIDSLRKIFSLIKDRPELHVVGDAHSHPPGSDPLPSLADSAAWSKIHPNALKIIYGALTIRSPEIGQQNFLAGTDAKNLIESQGQSTGEGSPRMWDPTDSYGYTEPTSLSTFGGQSSLAYYTGNNADFRPATHTFFGGRRISTPNQIQIMGSNGGPAIAPTTLGTTESFQIPLNTGLSLGGIFPKKIPDSDVQTSLLPELTIDDWLQDIKLERSPGLSSLIRMKSFNQKSLLRLQKAIKNIGRKK